MKKTIITVVITLLVLTAAFLLYLVSGAYDISQLTPHNMVTKTIIGITTNRSIHKRMKENTVPNNLTDTTVIAEGFRHYAEMCSGCHGTPGATPEQMPQGWYPKPPALYKHAKEDEAQEFFWITKNGVKMTSMPAFKPYFSDEKIWAITAFVTQALPKMTPEEYKAWQIKYAPQQ